MISPIIMTKFFYRHGLLNDFPKNEYATLHKKFSIWNEAYIHTSLNDNGKFLINNFYM